MPTRQAFIWRLNYSVNSIGRCARAGLVVQACVLWQRFAFGACSAQNYQHCDGGALVLPVSGVTACAR